MIIFVFSGLISIYVVARLIWPMGLGLKTKLLASFFLLLVSQHHAIIRTFSGSLASPEVPAWIIMVCGWLYGAFILAAALCLLKDLGILCTFLLRPIIGISVVGFLKSRSVLYGIVVIALSLSAMGVWQAVRVPEVVSLDIYLENLPEEFDGLRIVQLTDIHASSLLGRDGIEQVVAKANALKPDLIVLTGDIVDGVVSDREEDVEPLARLEAPLGIYATTGNHEYYSDYAAWIQKFADLKLNLLLNAHVIISRNGAGLILAGTTDRAAGGFGLPQPDISQALAGAPAGAVIILLEHQPGNAVRNADAGVSLQLSGHTHGGQFIGLRVVAQLVNNGFLSGLYQVGDMQLYVSNGTGLWAGLPVRVGVPPEITEITLRRPL